MSQGFFESENSQRVRSKRVPIKSDSQFEFKGYLPREAIPPSEALTSRLITFFMKCDYPFRMIEPIPFEEPIRSEVRRFFLSLDAYIDSPNPVIPYKDILYGAASPGYSDYLKKVKRKAFQSTWHVDNFSIPEWWNDIPTYTIKDIGDIFNYGYLIFWEEPDPDDYLEGFKDVSISEKTLKHFKERLRDLLPDRKSFEKIDEFEVLKTISSSMSYDRKNDKSLPHYRQKCKRLYFSDSIGTCKRSVIRVSPSNTRDSVLLDPADLNTISLIDSQLIEILAHMSGHIHLRNKNEITKRLKSLSNNYEFFIQRDLKKEGITKPRQLLKAMLEVLHEEYPDIYIFGFTSFFDSFSLKVGDQIVIPRRGHGLGMANALTTLMQLTVHSMVEDRLLDDIPGLDTDVLCLNDDFTVGFNCEEHVDAYWDMEDEIMDELSLIRVPDKSFVSRYRFVLAERYFIYSDEYEKVSYQLRELLMPLACYNVVHAKMQFIAAQVFCDSKIVDLYKDEYSEYWGYELYPTEFDYPAKVGGWVNEKILGIDMTLVSLSNLELKSYVWKGFNAAKTQPYIKGYGPNFQAPIFTLLGSPKIPEEFSNFFDILPQSQIDWKYGRMLRSNSKEFCRYWDDYKSDRLKSFNKDNNITFDDLLCEIISHYNTDQFYPCDDMVKQYHPGNIFQVNINDIYIDPNPYLALVSKFNEIDYKFKESYSIRFSNPDTYTKKTADLFSKDIQRSIKTETISNLLIGHYHEILWPRDEFHPEEQYINPIGLGATIALIDWGRGYPEVYDRFKNTLIEEKREIYGRLFTLEECIKITEYSVTRSQLKIITEYANHTGENLCDLIEYIAEKAYIPEEFEEPIKYEIYDDRDPYLIGIPDLFQEGLPKLYLWRNDRDSFRFEDQLTYEFIWRMNDLINSQMGNDWNDKIIQQLPLDVQRYKDYHPILKEIIERAQLDRIFEATPSLLESEETGDLLSAFFEEEDYG